METAAAASTAPPRCDKTRQQRLGQRTTEAFGQTIERRLSRLLKVERKAGLVERRQRPERASRRDGGRFDEFRRRAFADHCNRLVEIGREDTRGEEARTIANAHGDFAE